jgi:hypothetical protein
MPTAPAPVVPLPTTAVGAGDVAMTTDEMLALTRR